MTQQQEPQFMQDITKLMQQYNIDETVVVTRSADQTSGDKYTCHLMARSDISQLTPGKQLHQLCSKLMHSILMGVTRILNEVSETEKAKQN